MPENNKKFKRLLEVFLNIRSGKVNTKIGLASEFQVHEKTIQNYISELRRDFNVEIKSVRYGNQYIYKIINEGEFEQLKGKISLTSEECVLIITSLIQAQPFMEKKITIIKEKLFQLLSNEESEKLKKRFLSNSINIDTQYERQRNIEQTVQAIGKEKKIKVVYRSSNKNRKDITLTPYTLAFDMGKYYVIGKIDDKDYISHLRIDRIKDIKILDEKGHIDDGFDVNTYLKRTWYMYGGDETRVIVKFNKVSESVVIERNMSDGQVIEYGKDYFIYEFISNGTKGIKLWLLGFGGDAEVLEPKELREEMKKIILDMKSSYNI